MGLSDRRRKLRAEQKARKAARLKNPGMDSKYARKLRGIYPRNSPYLTGDWGQPMKKLRSILEQRAQIRQEVQQPLVGYYGPR